MTVRVSLKTGPVTKTLRAPYSGVTVTVRRLRSPEWDSARERAQAIVRNDADLLNLLAEHDLLPNGSMKEWKRLKDKEPVRYVEFIMGIAMWLTAVECALVGVAEWTGIELEGGGPAPLDRKVLEVVLLDQALSDQIMAVLTEAARLLIVEGELSGA